MDMEGVTKFSLTEQSSSYSYQWNFGGKTLRDFLLFNELDNGLASTSDKIRFRCGILAFTAHHVQLYIDETCDVYVKIYIGRTVLKNKNISQFTNITNSLIHRVNVGMKVSEANKGPSTAYRFEQLSGDEVAKLVYKRICRDEDIKAVGMNATVIWFRLTTSASNFWGYRYSKKDIKRKQNSITDLNFQIQIFHRHWQKNSLNTKNYAKKDSELTNLNSTLKPGFLNTASLFLSQEFSDFVIKCGSKKFPVHKLIIANMSPVLAAMLQQPLKEVQEGFMTITDSDPSTVEQFIKFMYTGTANIEVFATELFLIADKYAVEDLKVFSENVLVKKVNGDNFLELYKVGRLVNSADIMNKCFNIFKMKKNDLIKTTKDIKRFSEEYPDLMLKLSQSAF